MHWSARSSLTLAFGAAVLSAAPRAQPVFRGDEVFPPEEFAAHRAKVLDRIGDGVAIVLGTPGPPGEMPFRQNSQFFYLTGVTEPRAYVAIDGRTIGVHKRPVDVIANAVKKMDAVMASYHFTDDRIKAAAVKFVDGFRSRTEAASLGHNVGLEVHDPGGLQAETLEPGRIFTIEPQMRIEEEHIGLRLEDMILITDTGYENLSRFVPVEVGDIEKTMAEPGLSDRWTRGPRKN